MSDAHSLVSRLAGHLWTVLPTVRHRILPRPAPESVPWQTVVEDAAMGPITLHGRYRHVHGARSLVVLVHGLGGHPDSAYMVEAARAAERAGMACLRLGLRGADGSGEDFYNAGLTADLHAALADAACQGYDRVYALGFSLGAHVALKAAVEGFEASVDAVAAICPPLDLAAVQRVLDSPRCYVYREYILRELRAMYRQCAERGRVPTPWERVRMVRTLREWDALTVVPRFGFCDVDDYYATQSIGPRLDGLKTPALLMAARHDPMIPHFTVEPMLDAPPELLEVRWLGVGGHVFFPPDIDLGQGPAPGVVDHALAWLERA